MKTSLPCFRCGRPGESQHTTAAMQCKPTHREGDRLTFYTFDRWVPVCGDEVCRADLPAELRRRSDEYREFMARMGQEVPS